MAAAEGCGRPWRRAGDSGNISEWVFGRAHCRVNWDWIKDCQGALKVKNIPLSGSQASVT